ncbi:SBBP repeat-containing protein [Candidatus Brocadia sinica]|uniref:Protein with FOG domain and PKD repeat n=1 Tax=Candidatus Brocadia sinica JPN1 TaxID=1197129 RepID=A0ABQ0JU58_9BACT|nr:SBBP repeat-containing protein [Candidatus Brocadia sinica]GAN32218.1 protein with FOG domain and PKD repeat [Candidatus Brocadia sinica JPN1]
MGTESCLTVVKHGLLCAAAAWVSLAPLMEVANSASADTNWQTNTVNIQERYGKLPLHFTQNNGQMDTRVRFYEKGSGHATFFTERGMYLSLVNAEVVRLIPLGARNNPEITAEELLEGKVNYLIGNDPGKWKTKIRTHKAIVYKDIYKGIDMKFYGNNRQFEYDIIVNPGANPSRIQLSYKGIEDVKITEEGNMEIGLKEGKLIQKKPYVYQEIQGKKVEVDGRFVIRGHRSFSGKVSDNMDARNGQGQCHIYGFQVASYDKRYPLIIDPILIYSTYLGGSRPDYAYGIAVDSAGNAYVTGRTWSPDFPVVNAIDKSRNKSEDVFITKLNAEGTGIVYSTYLGGNDRDYGYGIAVDSAGNAYVAGRTISSDFPVVHAIDDSGNGEYDAFVTKLNAEGTSIVYSTYLGGSDRDHVYGIAVDSARNAYIAGWTISSDFPVVHAIDDSGNGECDGFITKLNAEGTSIVYSTYLGGSSSDYANGIAVDSGGNAYITGWTWSPDFPVAHAIDDSGNGKYDAFVTKLNAEGTSIVYSTYLGGSSSDYANGIAVDSGGNAYITGWTWSLDFPVEHAIDDSGNGVADTFITKLFSESVSITPTPTPAPSPDPTVTPTTTGTPTAITLAYFNAKAGKDGRVTLMWETATEVGNAGFNLYRSKDEDGDYVKINKDGIIPARGDAVSGASYSLVDTPGKGTFYYKLEDVDEIGVSAMYGPEKVRVRSDDATIKGLKRQKRK